jgi:hypothetical protein
MASARSSAIVETQTDFFLFMISSFLQLDFLSTECVVRATLSQEWQECNALALICRSTDAQLGTV